MTPNEIDNALTELSTRLERVRALYEQYFMGIERTEPNIPRKDLDRRVEALRKVPFQNTAKRFKFQTLVQRYTSLQQYWYRTCRDIENGTYRKHLQRARRRFGEDENKSRSTEEQRKLAERAASAKEKAEDDLVALLDGDVDLNAEFENVLADLQKPGASPAPKTSLLSGLTSNEGRVKNQRAGAGPQVTLGKLNVKPSIAIKAQAGSSRAPHPRTSTSPKPLPPLKSPLKPASPTPRPLGSAPKAAPAPRPLPASPKPAGLRPPGPAPRAAPAPRPKAPAARPGLSEDRIRTIHAQYQNARAQTKAAAVSFEKLEQNIRKTEAQLRAKHKGRNVDFDVAIKDGKAILKPKLK